MNTRQTKISVEDVVGGLEQRLRDEFPTIKIIKVTTVENPFSRTFICKYNGYEETFILPSMMLPPNEYVAKITEEFKKVRKTLGTLALV